MKSLLCSPGPVMVETPIREALMHYDICHRSPEFEEMFVGLQKINCLSQVDDSYESLIVSGVRLDELLTKYDVPTVRLDFGWATTAIPCISVRRLSPSSSTSPCSCKSKSGAKLRRFDRQQKTASRIRYWQVNWIFSQGAI